MSWRVLPTDSAFEGLSLTEQEAVSSDLFPWVNNGPPRGNRRMLSGVELFEDEVPCGYRVTYFVHEAEHYVAIVRVRKT